MLANVSIFGRVVLGFLAVVAAVGVAYLWFLPYIIAKRRNHPYKDGIGIICLFFGLTVLGWVVALVWALSPPKPSGGSDGEVIGRPTGRRVPCPACHTWLIVPPEATLTRCTNCGERFPLQIEGVPRPQPKAGGSGRRP